MEWLIDLVAPQGRMLARVLTPKGDLELISLDELHARGLPTEPTTKAQLRVNLSELRQIDPTPALAALGFEDPGAIANKHATLCLEAKDSVFIFPALALMRALFLPNKLLLANMFRPHSLERVSYVSSDGQVVPNIPSKPLSHLNSCKSLVRVLDWMCTTDSGRKTADSVHLQALGGKINFIPPDGISYLRVQGIKFGKDILVTEVRIVNIGAVDGSKSTSENNKQLEFRKNMDHKRTLLTEKIPLNSAGQIELSDKEFEAIAQLLEGKRKNSGSEHLVKYDRRTVIDDILRKLSSGASWKNNICQTNRYVALSAYYNWGKDDTWIQIMAIVKKHRGALEGAGSTSVSTT